MAFSLKKCFILLFLLVDITAYHVYLLKVRLSPCSKLTFKALLGGWQIGSESLESVNRMGATLSPVVYMEFWGLLTHVRKLMLYF